MKVFRAFCLALLSFALTPLYADDAKDAQLFKISAHVWMHTSYETIGGSRTDSHGLAVDTPQGVVLIDTCWNDAQTATLLGLIKREFKKPVVLAIVTHAHQDRIGGIRMLLKNKIKVVSTPLTAKKAAAAGFPAPKPELDPVYKRLLFSGFVIETFFPGPAHTVDNLTVYIPADRVLFGGCLVKPLAANGLGNIADASVDTWTDSLENLIKKFPDSLIVVPGHGAQGGPDLLTHTLQLVPAG